MIELPVTLTSTGGAVSFAYPVPLGYTKNKGVYRLLVTAEGEWEGLTIRCFWHLPGGTDPASSLVQDGTVDVPASVTAQPGNGCITFEGSDGVKTVTSADLRYRVGSNSGTEDGTMPEPGTPAWEQLVSETAVALEAVQNQIGNLDDLTTKAKETLVEAINEAARTGSGVAGSITMRTDGGYIQYSTDNGSTWENLIALAELEGKPGENGADGYSPTASVEQSADGAKITITDKSGTTEAVVKNGKDGANGRDGADGQPGRDGTDGAPGRDGVDGQPGKDGMDGITPTIGDNGNWFLGATDTGKPSRGATGAQGPAGADGKSAYQYAQDGGYTGTEVEFAAKLAQDIPAVDSTLTQSGKAADAAAVGDRLSALSEEIVKPVEKTVEMTQPVGVDEEGRLWSAPTAGGSGGGKIEWKVLTDIELAEESAISIISYDAEKYSAFHARLILPKVSEPINLTNNFKFLHNYGLYYIKVGDSSHTWCAELRCEIVGEYVAEFFSNRAAVGIGVYANLTTRASLIAIPEKFECGGTAVFPVGTKLTVWGRM